MIYCQFYRHSVKTLAQLASNRHVKTFSAGESITSCGSLFHGRIARTAKGFALAAAIITGFRKAREWPLRLLGGRRAKSGRVKMKFSFNDFEHSEKVNI